MAAATATAVALATVVGMEVSLTVMPPYPATGLDIIWQANTIYAYTGTLPAADGTVFRAVKIGLDNNSIEGRLPFVGQYAAVAYHAQQTAIRRYVKSTKNSLKTAVRDLLFEGGMYWLEAPKFKPGSGTDIKCWMVDMEKAAHKAAEDEGLVKAFPDGGSGLTEWFVLPAQGSIEDDEVKLRRVVNKIFPDLARKDSDGAVAITLDYPVQLWMDRPDVLPDELFPKPGTSFRALRGRSHAHDAVLSPHGAASDAVAPKGRLAHAGA